MLLYTKKVKEEHLFNTKRILKYLTAWFHHLIPAHFMLHLSSSDWLIRFRETLRFCVYIETEHYHRVNTYRDITSLPTFLCACSASYWSHTWSSLASNTQSKIADRLLTTGGTCRACAVDHFLPGRVKKVGT